MPMWTPQDECGLLLEHAGQPVLQRDDGGTWRLEFNRRYRHFLGRRVRVTGSRDEFDLIAVKAIVPL